MVPAASLPPAVLAFLMVLPAAAASGGLLPGDVAPDLATVDVGSLEGLAAPEPVENAQRPVRYVFLAAKQCLGQSVRATIESPAALGASDWAKVEIYCIQWGLGNRKIDPNAECTIAGPVAANTRCSTPLHAAGPAGYLACQVSASNAAVLNQVKLVRCG